LLLGRSTDRLGKSIRTSSGDALIADATDPEYRGVAFGLRRAMDTCRAALGPLAALLIVLWKPGVPLPATPSVTACQQLPPPTALAAATRMGAMPCTRP
jgi:hypothetical protein